jgi:hypothetical protein
MAEEPLKERSSSSPADIGLPEIPGYRIEETLGRGSTGVVYRATQLAVDREVALKVLHPDLAGRPRAVRRLQREARTAAKLAHPNIVSAIDMGQVGPLWWYAMELVVGESLAARLKRVGRLTEREALRVFTPLVDALDHAYRQSVVHRDIKPANILIDKAGRARLVDLGLAFREDDPLITSPGSTLGTPHYVSPEQARNPGQADTRSDIWSLGATFYHAVCGRPPFAGESVAEILSGVLYGRVTEPRELVPGLSRSLSLVLRKCLARDPAGRYQSPHDLLEDLERCREKRSVLVQPSALDPVRNNHPWRARAPWIAGGAALLALALWLARDVVAPAVRPSEAAISAAEPWAELEAVASAAARPGARPAPLLVELAALGPVSSRHRARYEELEEGLVKALREAQDGFIRRLGFEVDRLVARRDFKGALELLAPDGFAARAREELEVDSTQLRQLEARARPQELRERVGKELESYAAALSASVEEHVTKVLDPRVDNEQAAGRWRSAFEQLSIAPTELLQRADIVVAGLPDERIETLEGGLKDALALRRDALAREWTRQDGELADWVRAQARELEASLQARDLQGAAAGELAKLYQARAAELHLAPAEELINVSSLATQAVDAESARLVELERHLLEEDARAWLANEERQAAELQHQRRYREQAELWKRALERSWLAPVHGEVAVNLRGAELVAELLDRAARGVLALDGQRVAVLYGSIQLEGKVLAGSSPLLAGFSLVTQQLGTVALALRPVQGNATATPYVLAPDAIERFAGLSGSVSSTPDPSDRLARALLRYHEGAIDSALEGLPIDPTGDPVLDALASRLWNEANRKSGELRAQMEQRANEATQQAYVVLRLASEAVEPAERDAALRAIDKLLASWSDAQPPALESELRKRKAELGSAQAPDSDDFRARFGPTKATLEAGQFELAFAFGPNYEGRWSRGEWVADEKGWIARGAHERSELSVQSGWPELDLGPPIDLDEPLELALTFDQPMDSGDPQLLVVSLAGVHVALRGAQGSERARLQIRAGGPDELRQMVEEIDRTGRGSPSRFGGTLRGERYTLSIELSRKRGRAIVRLWGLDRTGTVFSGEILENQMLPAQNEAAPSVVVRSIEPVRIVEAKLRGRAVPFY